MNGTHAPSSHAPHIPYPHAHPHMNGHAPAPVAGPSSQHIDMGSASSPTGHATSTGSSSGQPKFSNGPHIRSRITVVCAECKRLKLKCDRRTPCSSCLKRDTVTRCVYTQAAAEKIDVQSIHNRVLILEGFHAKVLEAPPGATIQSILDSMGSKGSHGGAALPGTPGAAAVGSSMAAATVPSICNDRALLATGASGSSVVISLDDVTSIWLTEFDDILHGQMDSSTGSPSAPRVKVEPTPVLLSAPAPFASASVSSISSLPRFVPPIPYSKFLPSPEPVGDTHVTNGTDLFPSVDTSVPEPLPQVTPQLLKHLPLKERRAEIVRRLEETMVLHPCFHVAHWLKRVEAMIAWGESSVTSASPVQAAASATTNMRDVFYGASPSKRAKAPQPKPTLSFFASACAGLALGALVASKGSPGSPGPDRSPASHHSSSRPGTSSSSNMKAQDEPSEAERCSHAALFALSEQALSLAERTAAYDVDAVVAMLLQVLYLLHSCPGGMSVQQGVFPLVGKMVNVARMMGLANDPDDFPGTYSLFDAETRRRIWWDVFYYDLFVSDCMGHPPLIPDNSFTTRLPADVDEDAFRPSSTVLPAPSENVDGPNKSSAYFVLKCRLAQLVKNVKKQTFRDPLGDDPSELSIDQAALFEADVTAFLADLPPSFRLELNRDWSEPAVALPPTPAECALFAQKCELVIVANRLILKLYLPFLKDGHSGAGKHQAALATLNAAHAIIYASRVLHAVWATMRPAAFDLYDFGRALFDAAVVCAHAVVQQPASLFASEALKGVAAGLEVLKALSTDRSADKNRADAVRIVEMMKRKAESARANGGSSSAAGVKRKRDVAERMEPGFQLPYVGPSVSSVKPDPGRSPSKAQSGAANIKDMGVAQPDGSGRKEKKQMREKDRDKGRLPVGIRARPSQPPNGTSRPRGASVSTHAAPVPVPAPVQHSLPPPRHTATPASGPSSATSSSTSHMQALPPPHAPPAVPSSHDAYAQRAPPTPVHDHMVQDDFSMQFPGDDVDRRRYGSTFSDSPPGASMFDPASLSQPSPVSYGGGPTPPGAYYQYAQAPQPTQGYDNAPPPMGHPQNVAPPMGSLAMDVSASQGNLAMPTMVDSRYGMQTYRPEHTQAMPPHEYHAQPPPPPQPQGMSMSGTHTWLPPEQSAGPDMWNEYKYVD